MHNDEEAAGNSSGLLKNAIAVDGTATEEAEEIVLEKLIRLIELVEEQNSFIKEQLKREEKTREEQKRLDRKYFIVSTAIAIPSAILAIVAILG